MDRYSRQASFPPLGQAGQEALRRASVTVVGCGALGSNVADILARAGVGRLRLVDRDVVELSNLQRQALFTEADADLALPKAVAAAQHLAQVRSDLAVDPVVADLDGSNAATLLEGSDVVIDGTDNFEARHVLNEAALALSLPWVHGACLGEQALAWAILPDGAACYACLVPDAPAPGEVATCETAGVLGSAVHVAAALQACEAIKILAGKRADVRPGPVSIQCWSGVHAQVRALRDPGCRACVRREWRYLGRARAGAAVTCGRTAVQVGASGGDVDLAALAARLGDRPGLRRNGFLVRFPADEHDVTIFRDGRVLVSGTRDVARARSIAARFLG